jgi:hypothetical protein
MTTARKPMIGRARNYRIAVIGAGANPYEAGATHFITPPIQAESSNPISRSIGRLRSLCNLP